MHYLAKLLALNLCEMEQIDVDLEEVETNMVHARINHDKSKLTSFEIRDKLNSDHNIRVLADHKAIRFVISHGMSEADIKETTQAFELILI